MQRLLLRYGLRRWGVAALLVGVLAGLLLTAGLAVAYIEIRLGVEPDTYLATVYQIKEDLQRLEETGTIGVTRNRLMALSPDGARLCVTRDIGSLADPRGGVSIVDLTTDQVQTALISEERPPKEKFGRVFDSAWSPDGNLCFLAVSQTSGTFDTGGSNRLEIVNVSNGSPEFLPPVILGPAQNSFSPFGPLGVVASATRAYVADRGSAVVHVIDTHPDSPSRFSYLSSIPAGGAVSGVDLTPDGTRLYAVNRGPSDVVCIDTASNQAGGPACQGIGSIPVSAGPSGSGARIAVSPDGLLACAVFNLGADCVSCIDTNPESPSFNQEISVIPTTG